MSLRYNFRSSYLLPALTTVRCLYVQIVRSEVFAVRRQTAAPRDGDESPGARVPFTLFHMRHLLSAAAERRTVRFKKRPAVLPTGLRKGNVPTTAI